MINWAWINATATQLSMVLLSSVGIYLILLFLTRITGLRSFSKMSSFDFAITVALGSIIASTILNKDPSLLVGAFGLSALFGIQYVVSAFRRSTQVVGQLVDNQALLIMAGSEVLCDHLDQARMTTADLQSQLRKAGISHPNQVFAVVFETTGDVSVTKKSDEVDPWLFEGICGFEKLSFESQK